MPIYEFKCSKCNEFFEILVMNQNENIDLRCPKCKSEEFERILSTTSHTVGASDSKNRGVSVENRTCSSGSCTTYEIPGPTR